MQIRLGGILAQAGNGFATPEQGCFVGGLRRARQEQSGRRLSRKMQGLSAGRETSERVVRKCGERPILDRTGRSLGLPFLWEW